MRQSIAQHSERIGNAEKAEGWKEDDEILFKNLANNRWKGNGAEISIQASESIVIVQ